MSVPVKASAEQFSSEDSKDLNSNSSTKTNGPRTILTHRTVPRVRTQAIKSARVVTKRPVTVNHKAFLEETEAEQRDALRRELCEAIIFALEQGKHVYLENFGILIPETVTRMVSRKLHDQTVLRQESERKIVFEKCAELTAFHRSKLGKLVEVKDLASRIHPRLPLSINHRWTEADTRRYLRGLIKLIKNETTTTGRSEQLMAIGTFCSLHNRQGSSTDEWFAGSDVFLHSRHRPTITVGPAKVIQRPRLRTAWEPLGATYDLMYSDLRINLLTELSELGYDPSFVKEQGNDITTSIELCVFTTPGSRENTRTLIYCTNGLRNLGYAATATNPFGTELVLQIDVEEDAIDLPQWPFRPITMAWVLLMSAKARSLTPGTGFTLDDQPIGPGSVLNTIFTTNFNQLREEVLCEQGRFKYINIVGVTAEEALVAKQHSPTHLLCLLEHKQLDQRTKLTRSPLALGLSARGLGV